MLDLHCHILPGIDDGAASLQEALAMARFCVADGIAHITATPHCHRHLRLLRADILPHVARLNEALDRAGIPLTVLPGSEIQLTDTAAYRRRPQSATLFGSVRRIRLGPRALRRGAQRGLASAGG
jgi:protein-tyrosine phosphatase